MCLISERNGKVQYTIKNNGGKNHGLVTTIYVPYHLLTGLQHQYLKNKKDLLKGVINMTGSKFNIKKWFSMKNDTVEDAQQRFKRSLICIPFSIVPSLCLMFLQDAEMSRFVEYSLFAVFCVCILSSFVALSSLIGPIKASVRAVKWVFKKPLSGILVILYPFALVGVPLLFILTLLSTVYAPIFLTLYGVYLSKKNLDEVKEREMFAYSAPEAE